MSKLRLAWASWLYGLLGGMIGGGASSVVSGLSAVIITPHAYNLGGELTHTLKLVGLTFVGSGIISACLWLRQRPLPEIQEDPPAAPPDLTGPARREKP